MRPLRDIIGAYDPHLPLERASTIPASWYTDPRVLDLELRGVFTRSWQVAGRGEQLREAGRFVTCEIAHEPVVVVRGGDNIIRAFFNVCRHHAAAVMTAGEGLATSLRCPYHGWTYSLQGELKGTPDFSASCDFDCRANALMPVAVSQWEKWVLVNVDSPALPLDEFLGDALQAQIRDLQLERLSWMERRRYVLDCNWKVFVDNYLDGGYHVPYLHEDLDSVLDYRNYTIESGERYCLQSSPHATRGRALYYWIYPNFMVNWYGIAMDTNLVVPLAVNRTEVIFDFYFADISDAARPGNLASIAASEQIQDEDVAICASVQRGLGSRAYTAGRLSPRREAGEHLFHRLLHRDLQTALTD